MRFTVIGQFFPPETFAGANRVSVLARSLAAAGEVTVSAPRPSYPRPSLYEDAPALPVVPRLRVVRTGMFVPHGRSFVGRALAELRMAFRLAAAVARAPADVVVASSPGMFLGPAGLCLARLRRVPFVWDVRDLTWEYVREVTAASPLAWLGGALLGRAMWAVVRRSDLLVAATPGIATELRRRGARTRVVVVPNGIDASLLELFAADECERTERTPAVTYAGLIGRPQALGVLCDVARLLPDVTFNIVGEGSELGEVVRRAESMQLANVRFLGYVSRERLAAVYRESDVLFAQLHASGVHSATGLPSKLWEYMAAARPIVYAGEGLAVERLDGIGCAFCVAPGDADAIAAAVSVLVSDRERASAMGSAGRRFVEARVSREDAMSALVPEIVGLVSPEARERTAVAA